MPSSFVTRLQLSLALFWTLISIFFFLGLSVAIFREPGFALNLGFLRATGRAGLWITFVPAAVGLVGVILMLARNKRLGWWFIGGYCIFWALAILSGLPAAWNAKRTFCIDVLKFCIVTPWISRIMVLGLATAFFLVVIWAWKSASSEQVNRA